MRTIRWGILGTGDIAGQFASALQHVEGAELYAVGSRQQDSANLFADKHGIPKAYSSYQALCEDDTIDVVYIGTPHTLHQNNSLMCLEAGKAVLCEKPLAVSAAQAEEVIASARSRKLFLMEAMWTRFIPLICELRQLQGEGVIGELRMLQADFCFRADFDPQSRLFNPELAGGALLDVGIYPLSFASMLLGTPLEIRSLASISNTGIDEQSAYLLGYANGALALLASAVRTEGAQEALLLGSEGSIRLHTPWWRPDSLSLQRPGQAPDLITRPIHGNGYNYEAAEVTRCLQEGKLESSIMPLAESLSIMRSLDRIREQIGLRYPFETSSP